jgi:hypothetical protein
VFKKQGLRSAELPAADTTSAVVRPSRWGLRVGLEQPLEQPRAGLDSYTEK